MALAAIAVAALFAIGASPTVPAPHRPAAGVSMASPVPHRLALGASTTMSPPQRLALVVTRVIDQDGSPVVGARVRLIRCVGPRIVASSLLPALAPPPVPGRVDESCEETIRTTDEQGEASFPSLRASPVTIDRSARRFTYVLRAEKDGYEAAGDVITPHPARNDVDLVMFRGGSLPLELVERARREAEAGDFDAAVASMGTALDLVFEGYRGRGPAPEALVSWLRYRASLQVQGADLEGARASLDRLLELDPYDIFGLRTLGVLAVRAREWEEARGHFGLYLLLDGDSADAWLMMGSLLVETDDIDDAIEHLERAIELDPEEPRIHRALGMAHVGAGNSAEAIAYLERYLQRAETPPDAAQIRATIESLRR